MMHRIKESYYHRGVFSHAHLERQANKKFIFCCIDNRNVAIDITGYAGRENEFMQVAIVESHQMPLYKQHMELMMGRVPRAVENTRMYRPLFYTKKMAQNRNYVIFDVIC